jgi:hypothetical protein
MRLFPLILLLTAASAFAARPCFSPDEALAHSDKDVCVTAHVYEVVESPDGIRYLDVCKPKVAEGACHFTVISLPADRKEVGDLDSYRDQDIHIRGVVHTMHGQSTIVLSHARQFKDGAEKFRPNPALMAGFSADRAGTAFKDPALTAHRHKSTSAFLGSPQ